MRITRKLWIGIAILVVLSPLGLLLPAWLGGGTAWGEWSAGELQKMLGYVPAGMRHLDGIWKAPLPDYGVPGSAEVKPAGASAAYILSAVVGAVIVTVLAYALGRLLSRREEAADDT